MCNIEQMGVYIPLCPGVPPQLIIRICAALKGVVIGPIWSGERYMVCLRSVEKVMHFCKELSPWLFVTSQIKE